MKIFIGSSSRSMAALEKVAGWLIKGGHEPICWPSAFSPGNLLDQLITYSREVDGAIMIFGTDEPAESIGEAETWPHGNVTFEYGLFMGVLGAKSVAFVRFGKANIPSDLGGWAYFEISQETNESDEQQKVLDWAAGLTPIYLKGLGFDLADQLTSALKTEKVEDILLVKARNFITRNKTLSIKALCSDKGKHGKVYYQRQFDWLAENRARKIQRVFVRQRDAYPGFSTGEIEGIRAHLFPHKPGVEIKWIFSDSESLGGPYFESMGFAIFGPNWIVHWGTETGTYHDNLEGLDKGVRELLKKRFTTLWKNSREFDQKLLATIREEK